ncbi:DUF1707 domain-containing protein [Amycolatopsis rubida]|uniref:DUF1707 domain-containing protein n=1 Tax=Amycolatopsis rubida TaxID=112413 RepID=A0A1I5F720_9PSEU|nr:MULTISPECIES: DUF1707 domain-containing protein [Amycolatopsis]MYW92218.1 DUF1707 domain-containing protein [Amycolatopsis rubida]NEC57205.1 DUF1707 domain-containing protein [Amycolatopsis rubida]OAP27072.1 hypothetical protein A4R44_01877 [Amycolatopsis sp. M39]SFO19532.1 protein of unknown function [Amycolatopsis rubida]
MAEEETTAAQPATETKPLTARDIRVSDDEREHVVGVLQKAIGQGMLTLDEFTERTDQALAAKTRGDLNTVLADLPGLVHPGAAPQYAPTPEPPGYGPNYGLGQRLELNAKYSSLQRSGPWQVPAAMVVRNKYGSTKLDFTEARVATPVVQIELDSKWGSVELIIPQHAAVDYNSITEIKFGSLDDKTGSNGRAGTPRYVLTGRIHGGSLVIRHPRRGIFG